MRCNAKLKIQISKIEHRQSFFSQQRAIKKERGERKENIFIINASKKEEVTTWQF